MIADVIWLPRPEDRLSSFFGHVQRKDAAALRADFGEDLWMWIHPWDHQDVRDEDHDAASWLVENIWQLTPRSAPGEAAWWGFELSHPSAEFRGIASFCHQLAPTRELFVVGRSGEEIGWVGDSEGPAAETAWVLRPVGEPGPVS